MANHIKHIAAFAIACRGPARPRQVVGNRECNHTLHRLHQLPIGMQRLGQYRLRIELFNLFPIVRQVDGARIANLNHMNRHCRAGRVRLPAIKVSIPVGIKPPQFAPLAVAAQAPDADPTIPRPLQMNTPIDRGIVKIAACG